jgi:uncharacterized repeat protein (TIGR01451 family)
VQTWQCTVVASNTDLSNTATLTGTDPTGRPVSAEASALVQVVTPGIDISKTADVNVVRPGDTITYTVTVTNSGTTNLSGVTVTDPVTPSCAVPSEPWPPRQR